MSIVGVLQARMSSTRLPGKVLEPIQGMPMIGRQIERLQRSSGLDALVVATSSDPVDDPLAEFVMSLGIPVVRGSLDDVLKRFVKAMDEHGIDTVVRLTADCPLASPSVIDLVIADFKSGGADYVSNTLNPTFPDGLDVEVVRGDVLRWIAANSTDPHEHEHVTLGVYRRPEQFAVRNVRGPRDLSDLRWTVDNPDDLAFVREVYAQLYAQDPAFELDDVLALLAREPLLNRTSADAKRNAALEGLDTGAMTI
jgi:spore coat polysaccharide biosynthesis protein SpsF